MKPRLVPKVTTDEAAATILAQDQSDLDFARFRPLDWERLPKTARITMRVPEELVAALKAKAAARGIRYQRLIREAIEKAV